MVVVEQKDGGSLIDSDVLYGAETIDVDYINLSREKGEDLLYKPLEYYFVDYPGEYDMNGIFVKAMLGRSNKMSYILKIAQERIAIVQTTDILDRDDIGDMDVWLYHDQSVADKIEQLELEGEKKML